MLIDASLLALKEKADAGDLDAQIKMCRVYQVGSGAPVDYQKAIHYTLLILSHDPETMEKNGEEYDILLWAIGRFPRSGRQSLQLSIANEGFIA